MKPPENVTIIDLKGKVLYIIDPKEARHSNAYVRTYNKYENSQPHVVYSGDKTYVPMHPRKTQIDRTYDLSDFLNDQLTFIRNGMWETLAIYQATLGRYWEVPWYETTEDLMEEVIERGGLYGTWNNDKHYSNLELAALLCKQYEQYHEGVEGRVNEFWVRKQGLLGSKFRPDLNSFLKHYADVFSQLTPWKGA